MKRPGWFDYLVGNFVSVLALTVAAILLGIAAFASQVSWFAAIAGLVFMGWGWGANQRLTAYRNWKREWDTMNGVAEPVRSSKKWGPLRIAIVAVAWAVMAYVAIDQAQQPEMQIPVGLFWLATALLAIRLLYLMVRRRRSATTPDVLRRDMPVALCLAVPTSSPSVNEAMQGLPPHCRRLMSS